MSTVTATKQTKTTSSEPQEFPLVYELSRREKSAWVLKDQHNNKPQNKHRDINCAKILFVEMRSRWNGGKGKGEIEIQYVPGAPTIFVNDYTNGKGELCKGLKSLNYDLKGDDYRRAVQEDIKFVDGYLYLENYGGNNNPILLEYMYHHGSNEMAPNFVKKRNMNTMFLFKPMVKEKKAAAQLDNMDVEMEAMTLFNKLRLTGGENPAYDTAKLNAILGMLQEGQGLSENESAAKMLLIRPLIKNKPVEFMKLYNDTMKDCNLRIATGVSLKVIEIEPKEAKIKITGMEPIAIPLSKEKRDENVEALIFYFLGDESGRILYSQFKGEVEAKKIEALSKQ